jgi:hypothetical protein
MVLRVNSSQYEIKLASVFAAAQLGLSCAVYVIAICRGVLLNLLLDFEFEIMRHYVAIRLRF